MTKPITFTDLAKFQEKQLEAWFQVFKHKYLLYGGAASGGKSYFLRWCAIGLGMYYSQKYGIKGAPIGLFSEDYPTLKDRQVRRIKLEMPEWLGELKETKDEGLVFKSRYPDKWGDWVVLLRNLDDPAKYASAEFVAILVEELTKNPRDTFDDLRFRLRYPGVPDPKFIAATNPGGVGHAWVKSLWIQPDPESPDPEHELFCYIPARAYDNEYVDKSYITQLESLPEQKRKAYLDGSWDIFAGQVFSEWTTDKHVIEPIFLDPFWKRYISLDWGVNAPSAVYWYAIDHEGHIYVYRELYMNGDAFNAKYGEDLTPTRMAEKILELTGKDEKIAYLVADPACWNKPQGGESVAETMTRLGLPMIQGDNDRLNGLNRFREVLAPAPDGKPWLQFFKTCYNAISTIPSLVYDENRVEEVDTEGSDHAYDSVRYFVMSRPTKSREPAKQESLIQKVYKKALRDHNRKYNG